MYKKGSINSLIPGQAGGQSRSSYEDRGKNTGFGKGSNQPEGWEYLAVAFEVSGF